ncbi:MAG: hypothetical protein J5855_08885, partial [Mailhella sp.]|nr:hypothetical protein [Mailhella sp.]
MKRREFLCALGALSMGMFSGNASFAADLKILVAYFSATGTTKGVAESIARAMGGDLYRIEPEQPYTDADLDWHDKQSRSSVEMADKNARPAIRGALPDLGKYDAVFLGYPIWWAVASRIMSTFAEKCSLQGKTVAPFCT